MKMTILTGQPYRQSGFDVLNSRASIVPGYTCGSVHPSAGPGRQDPRAPEPSAVGSGAERRSGCETVMARQAVPVKGGTVSDGECDF